MGLILFFPFNFDFVLSLYRFFLSLLAYAPFLAHYLLFPNEQIHVMNAALPHLERNQHPRHLVSSRHLPSKVKLFPH